MITRILFIVLAGCSTMYSQVIRASDNLIFPVNPPRSISPVTQYSIRHSAETLVTVQQTQFDLKAALDSGLAKNHPKVKSLRAKLMMLQAERAHYESIQHDSDESTQLKIQIEFLKQNAKRDHDVLLNQIAEMKKEIAELHNKMAKRQETK